METKTIHVREAFELNLGGGRKVQVPAGVQVVPAEVADHWYTASHLAHGGLGTTEYAEATWGNLNDAFAKAREAGEHYERLLAASAEADEAAGIDARLPPHIAYLDVTGAATEDEPEVEAEVEVEAEAEPSVQVEAPVEAVETEQEAAPETASDETAEADEAAEEQAESPLDHDGKDGAGGSVAETSEKPFDDMTDDELRAFITKRDDKAPHHATGRTKLLAIARKEDGAEA